MSEPETSADQPADQPDATAPVLKIVTPDATPEEIAAIVAVFAALGGSAETATKPRRVAWNTPARLVRRPHRHGPDGWRLSGLPR